MIRRPPRSTHCISSAASDVYKRQVSPYRLAGNPTFIISNTLLPFGVTPKFLGVLSEMLKFGSLFGSRPFFKITFEFPYSFCACRFLRTLDNLI
eukprot:TRINITY_DN4793_c0_g1_i14.p2 TRINITY_DN4793_c0_g1~~TRINITY_DN4793_c0_g1_i14.p2  ORF type:complete len:102 (+),score=18.21 TRINITY_DN4793_c0_g1_i14:25-306(+)